MSRTASMMFDLPLLFSPTSTVRSGWNQNFDCRHERKLVASSSPRCTRPVQQSRGTEPIDTHVWPFWTREFPRDPRQPIRDRTFQHINETELAGLPLVGSV